MPSNLLNVSIKTDFIFEELSWILKEKKIHELSLANYDFYKHWFASVGVNVHQFFWQVWLTIYAYQVFGEMVARN